MDQVEKIDFGDAPAENLYTALFQCFTIIISGYVAGRLKIVSDTESKGIGTFVGTFALPSLIFLSLARLNFSVVNWTFLLSILLAKGVVFLSVMIITIFVSRPVNLGRAGIFAIFCTQSNDFALGFPIINALYQNTHPEYSSYLYLMAPISLAILNPIAFVLMEIHKQKQLSQQNIEITINSQRKTNFCTSNILKQIVKGIFLNPVLACTVLGILWNIAFKHQVIAYLEGLLSIFGDAFSATALFLLGLRMVGQIHRLKGPALLLPCVLIMVKLIILPMVMRESVSALKAGANESDTASLSTYAFLYGTIPTAPAVFVFSSLYQIEMDLMASSMVICTFISGPMMFMTAQVISIDKDYADQLKKLCFDLSCTSLATTLWVTFVFVFTKKYKRVPHRLTLCLMLSQLLLAVAGIWEGSQARPFGPRWLAALQEALCAFSTYSCLLWTAMLSVGLLMLQSRGPCFVITLWPVLGFVAWGAPAVMVAVLFVTEATSGDAVDAIRLCLLIFCITVTTGCLIVYIRFRRRSAQFASLSADIATSSADTATLVANAEPVSQSCSVNDGGGYKTITASPSPNRSNGCCSNDPDCAERPAMDIEDIAEENRDCACPTSQQQRCTEPGECRYLNELEQATSQIGLLPPEQTRGRGGQLLKHTVLIITYSFSMFIGITCTAWRVMSRDESGVFVEMQFLDAAARCGQALVVFILFGLDPSEVLTPALRYISHKWYGADTVVLPPVEELSFETRHVCDQFITHHLDRCREAIARDTRWRMRTYKSVFRGSCLVRWLLGCGLAKDAAEAHAYGRHLLAGRLIAHIHNKHHFTDSPLLYTFN